MDIKNVCPNVWNAAINDTLLYHFTLSGAFIINTDLLCLIPEERTNVFLIIGRLKNLENFKDCGKVVDLQTKERILNAITKARKPRNNGIYVYSIHLNPDYDLTLCKDKDVDMSNVILKPDRKVLLCSRNT
jgi:hypothetical protein